MLHNFVNLFLAWDEKWHPPSETRDGCLSADFLRRRRRRRHYKNINSFFLHCLFTVRSHDGSRRPASACQTVPRKSKWACCRRGTYEYGGGEDSSDRLFTRPPARLSVLSCCYRTACPPTGRWTNYANYQNNGRTTSLWLRKKKKKKEEWREEEESRNRRTMHGFSSLDNKLLFTTFIYENLTNSYFQRT